MTKKKDRFNADAAKRAEKLALAGITAENIITEGEELKVVSEGQEILLEDKKVKITANPNKKHKKKKRKQ